jgi:gamma-glutamyl:cysteine ligase YbdK (ATP-grasp superfamily)
MSARFALEIRPLKEFARPLGIGFLGLGMTPNWSRSQIPMMPKGRYRIMTAYMPKVGKHGLDMMYRTCTVQTNLDYSSEANMVKKLRLSLALQPVATAMFANSPFTEGKPNGFLSFRSEIWRDTDADRCGRRSSLLWASSATSTKPSDLMRACRGIERVMKLSLDIDPPEPLGAVAPQGRLPEDIGRLDYAFDPAGDGGRRHAVGSRGPA